MGVVVCAITSQQDELLCCPFRHPGRHHGCSCLRPMPLSLAWLDMVLVTPDTVSLDMVWVTLVTVWLLWLMLPLLLLLPLPLWPLLPTLPLSPLLPTLPLWLSPMLPLLLLPTLPLSLLWPQLLLLLSTTSLLSLLSPLPPSTRLCRPTWFPRPVWSDTRFIIRFITSPRLLWTPGPPPTPPTTSSTTPLSLELVSS